MSKGRNTTVVGVRLPDKVVNRLKSLARKNRQTITELLKPVITDFAVNGRDGDMIQSSTEVAPKQPRIIPSPQQDVFPKVGRNDPCPCGSGKKYKRCHGR